MERVLLCWKQVQDTTVPSLCFLLRHNVIMGQMPDSLGFAQAAFSKSEIFRPGSFTVINALTQENSPNPQIKGRFALALKSFCR